jgi:hypothetical protein
MLLDEITSILRTATRWDVAIRLTALTTALGVLGLAATLAPTGVPGLLVLLAAAGGALSAAFPGSHAAAAELVVLAWIWLAAVDGGTSGWTLLAALGVLLFHTATMLAAAAPLGGHPDRTFLAVIARRMGIVAMMVVAVWAVAALFDRGSWSAGPLVYSAALGAVSVLGVGVLLATRAGRSTGDA